MAQKTGTKREVGYKKPPVEHQFKPGNNANPGGRPKGSVSLTTTLRRLLAEIPKGQRKSWAQGFVEKTLKDAMAGDAAARKIIWEYMEGAPKHDVTIHKDDRSLEELFARLDELRAKATQDADA